MSETSQWLADETSTDEKRAAISTETLEANRKKIERENKLILDLHRAQVRHLNLNIIIFEFEYIFFECYD